MCLRQFYLHRKKDLVERNNFRKCERDSISRPASRGNEKLCETLFHLLYVTCNYAKSATKTRLQFDPRITFAPILCFCTVNRISILSRVRKSLIKITVNRISACTQSLLWKKIIKKFSSICTAADFFPFLIRLFI